MQIRSIIFKLLLMLLILENAHQPGDQEKTGEELSIQQLKKSRGILYKDCRIIYK